MVFKALHRKLKIEQHELYKMVVNCIELTVVPWVMGRCLETLTLGVVIRDVPLIMQQIIMISIFFIFVVLTPLSTIFQLYHGNQFQWWKKPEYPERTTDHGQATGTLYHLRVECILFCNLQSRSRTHSVLVDCKRILYMPSNVQVFFSVLSK